MRTPNPRPLFLLYLSSASRFPLRRFSASPSSLPPPSSSTPSSSSPSSRSSQSSSFKSYSTWKNRNDEESKAVRVTVWWDFENCSIPTGVSPYRVAHHITSALRLHGIKGPITITAFGDVLQFSRASQDALSSTGIRFMHVPNCGKNSADKAILADLMYWIPQNPPPAHFFLISGDKDFANILHRLRMTNYNILVASKAVSAALCSAATIMWQWNDLIKGDCLVGKHFNHPPDGLYASWYGHYKGALDNPFPDVEEASTSQPEESSKLTADIKTRPIPRALVNKISEILSSNPGGISVGELCREVKKSNIELDKDYYGHKKFNMLLAKLHNIAKLKPHPSIEGRWLVHSVFNKLADSMQSRLSPNEDNAVDNQNAKNEDGSVTISHPCSQARINERTSTNERNLIFPASHSTAEGKALEGDELSSRLAFKATKRPGLMGEGINLAVECEINNMTDANKESVGGTNLNKLENIEENHSEVKENVFRKLWKTLFRSSPESEGDKLNPNIISDSTREKTRGCDNEDTWENCSSGTPRASSSGVTIATSSNKERGTLEGHVNMLKVDSGIFNKISCWFNFKETQKEQNNNFSELSDVTASCQKMNMPEVHDKDVYQSSIRPETHDLFTKTYFWNLIESFFLTSKGSELIAKSTDRMDLIRGLQEEGPLVVKTLKDYHILHLVDLLISEKKWVDECTSKEHPFKLSLPVKRSCIPTSAHTSNGHDSFIMQIKSSSRKEQVLEDQMWSGSKFGGICDSNTEKKAPKGLTELKAWHNSLCDGNQDIDIEEFKEQYERDFGKKLDSMVYGYFTVKNLVAACSARSIPNKEKGKKVSSSQLSRQKMLTDCQKLVTEMLEENPAGFLLSKFKSVFMERHGYDLDHSKLGYPKFASLLKIMPGVRVESALVLPTKNFPHVKFNAGKPAAKERVPSILEGNRGVEDCAWEELGPLTGTRAMDNGKMDKGSNTLMAYDKASLSDIDDSESDEGFATGPGKRKKLKNDESSLSQILNMWYDSKKSSNCLQSADGLVDCSNNNSSEPLESKPSNSGGDYSNKCNVVSDSDNEEENITGRGLHNRGVN